MIQRSKIIIIGAGIAGLAAARRLIAAQCEVVILEARQRSGGRILTDYSLNVPFDLGAFIIHGTQGNPITALADHYQIPHQALIMGKSLLDRQQVVDNEQYEFIAEQFERLLEQVHQYAYQQPHDISLAQALQKNKNMQSLALSAEHYAWRYMFLTLYTGADPKHLSARHWNEDETPLPGSHDIMLNGYQPIIDILAKDLLIQFNSVVTQIAYDNHGVRVETLNVHYEADAVLVTVPLGVLKEQKIKFNPPLPANKQQAIQQLAMGVLDKIAFQFAQPFWSDDYPIIANPSTQFTTVSWFLNYHIYFNQPVLVAFVGGDLARQYSQYDDHTIKQEIMQVLRNTFGEKIPDPIRVLRTNWDQDPYSFGSYSYIPVGSSGLDYDTLAEAVAQRVFFAGEATNRQFPGTVHGAYLSGLRAAEEIVV